MVRPSRDCPDPQLQQRSEPVEAALGFWLTLGTLAHPQGLRLGKPTKGKSALGPRDGEEKAGWVGELDVPTGLCSRGWSRLCGGRVCEREPSPLVGKLEVF